MNHNEEATFNPNKNTGFQNQNQDQRQSKPDHGFDLARLRTLGRQTATGTKSDEYAETLKHTFTEISKLLASSGGVFDLLFIPVETAVISTMTVAFVYGQQITCCTCLIEDSIKPYTKPTFDGPNGRKIELEINTDKLYGDTMRSMIANTIKQLPQYNNEVIVSGCPLVIPKAIDLSSEISMKPYYDFAVVGILCLIRTMVGHPTSEDKAEEIVSKGFRLYNRIDVKPGATYKSVTGVPIAGDFSIVMTAEMEKQKTRNIYDDLVDDGNKVKILTSVIGYVDFLADSINTMNMRGNQAIPRYKPVVVISQSSCLGKTDESRDSLLSTILGLASLVPLISDDSNKWATVFEPFIAEGQTKTSIGVLGLEHNPFPGNPAYKQGVKNIIPGNDSVYDGENFTVYDFVKIFMTGSPVVCLDIQLGGPLEEIYQILARATYGSREEAIVINELDEFSNGLFSKLWHLRQVDGPQSILANLIENSPATSVNLYSGYYTDSDGKIRDIRSIDYLSVLERTAGDMVAFDQFASGFYPGRDDDYSMDQKKRILMQCAPNLNITGVITRVFFNNEFISCIDNMLSQLKLHYTVEGLADMYASGGRRQSLNSQYFNPVRSHGTFNYFQPKSQSFYYGRQSPYTPGGQNRF
jgi:hypothetical protein